VAFSNSDTLWPPVISDVAVECFVNHSAHALLWQLPYVHRSPLFSWTERRSYWVSFCLLRGRFGCITWASWVGPMSRAGSWLLTGGVLGLYSSHGS